MDAQKKDLGLIDLFVLGWKFIVKMFFVAVHCAGWCLRVLWQRKWVMLAAIAVGLIISLSDYFFGNSRNVTKAGFAVNTYSKKPYFSIEIIRNLDMDEFAEATGMTEEQKDAIISLNPYYVIDLNDDGTIELIDYTEKYKMEVDDPLAKERNYNVWASKVFYLEVTATDKEVIPVFRKALQDYLNASPMMITAWETNKEYEYSCIEVLESELRKVDSLQTRAIQGEESLNTSLVETRRGSTSTYGTGTYFQMLTWDKNSLKKLIYQHRQILNDLAEGPVFYNTPIVYAENPRDSIVRRIAEGVVIGLLLGYALVLLLTYRKPIAAFFNKK